MLLTVSLAVAILAAAALLPAWQRREDARMERDELARQVWIQQRVSQYKRELADALKDDPRQTEQLLIEQQNLHPPDAAAVPMDAKPDPPLVQQLEAKAPKVAPPNPALEKLAQRVDDPATRRGLLLVAGVLMVAAMMLFQPPKRQK